MFMSAIWNTKYSAKVILHTFVVEKMILLDSILTMFSTNLGNYHTKVLQHGHKNENFR